MSFFDEIEDDIESIVEQENNVETKSSLVGSVIYYDPVMFDFKCASANSSSIIDANVISDWRTIMLGTVINDYGDNIVDVLMGGFLMAEPLYLPFMYHHEDKRKYIRNYASSMFKRFVSAFFRQCPAYNDLLKLNIEMPTVSDMLTIENNYPDIFESLRVCSDVNKYNDYISRLLNTYIYVTHKGKIYMMLIKPETKEHSVVYPDGFITADFLCIFRKLNLIKEKADGDRLQYFK